MFRRVFISGSDVRQCILKLLDIVSICLHSDEIKEKEECIGRKLTVAEIVEAIEFYNGDGCDHIISLKDVISDDVLLYDVDAIDEEEYDADEEVVKQQPKSSLSYYEWIDYMELEDNDGSYDAYLDYCRSQGVEP